MRRAVLVATVLAPLVAAAGCTRPNPLYGWEAPCGGAEDSGTPEEDAGTSPDVVKPSPDATPGIDLGHADVIAVVDADGNQDGPGCGAPTGGTACLNTAKFTFENDTQGWGPDTVSGTSSPEAITSLVTTCDVVHCGLRSLTFHASWVRGDGLTQPPPSALSSIVVDTTGAAILGKTLRAWIYVDMNATGARAQFAADTVGSLEPLGTGVALSPRSWTLLEVVAPSVNVTRLYIQVFLGVAGTASGQIYLDDVGWY